MSGLLTAMAVRHLLSKKRQTIVCTLGIVLGVAFFLAISSLMRGSEKDFVRRLVDNTPHITIVDQFRNPREQPILHLYPNGAVEIRSVKPLTESRGIRGYEQVLESVGSMHAALASPVMLGQGLITYAGREVAVTLYGTVPEDIIKVSTLAEYIVEGSIDSLVSNPDGIIIGRELARKLSLSMADNITLTSPIGEIRTFKIVAIFKTGRADFDERQTFVDIKRAQALLNRPNRVNNIIIKLSDPYRARDIAAQIEQRISYKCISWQEASEDLINTLTIRNIIMYTVVSAVLIVAAFGIYNIISTVVLEKQRDIAILKSIGFYAQDIERIFILQGFMVGLLGIALGLPLGAVFMSTLGQLQLKPPGVSETITLPIDWGWPQFTIASAFALIASVSAAVLPARKAARLQPVHILRGNQ